MGGNLFLYHLVSFAILPVTNNGRVAFTFLFQVHVFAPPPSNSTTFSPREQRVKHCSSILTIANKKSHQNAQYSGELEHKVHGERVSAVQRVRPLSARTLLPGAGVHLPHQQHGQLHDQHDQHYTPCNGYVRVSFIIISRRKI